MEIVFLKIFNMSITAGWLIAAVMVLRIILKKAPRQITCVLWAFVAVRLMCPFSFETVFSLIPSAETVSPDIAYSEIPAIDSGVALIDNVLNPVIGQTFAPKAEDSANPLQILLYLAGVVWIAGMLVLLGYAVVSSARLRRRVRAAVPLRDNIWICDEIESPFILGILRPRIYLPSDTDKSEEGYILAHERAHLKRHDNWWKLLGFALLAVYWFHPLVWAAYLFLCRDIELACDERVIKDFSVEGKKAYSLALLSCSVSRRTLIACPLQFGEVGVKERVKAVLNYKKPGLWIISAAILVCGAVAVCFLTNPRAEEGADTQIEENTEDDRAEYGGEAADGQFYGYISELEGNRVTVDVQLWITPDDEEWKSEYDGASGFAVVDASSENVEYLLDENCVYSILENHWQPIVELSGEEFAECIEDYMEYPVLWIFTLDDGRIISIEEQYRP